MSGTKITALVIGAVVGYYVVCHFMTAQRVA